MNETAILSSLGSIIYAVDEEFKIQYASPQCSALTSKIPSDLIGCICYSELLGKRGPCRGCPIVSKKDETTTIHDIIAFDGDRKFFDAHIQKSDSVYVELLHNISMYKKEIEHNTYKIKELRSKQVADSITNSIEHAKNSFADEILSDLPVGIMVVDSSFNILSINDIVAENAGITEPDEALCYHVYGKSEPCRDCPFDNNSVTRSQRQFGDTHVTIQFKPHKEFLIECVRDTTREIKLIGDIQSFQKEVEEKQRQMGLLNRDLLRVNDKLKDAQRVINEDLTQVGNIQKSLLPDRLPDIAGYEFGAFYTPAETAGGDYYDCISMSNNYWGLTVADVSGHGASAAVIMAICRAIMRSYTYDVVSSSEAIHMVNEILCDNVHTKDFVTMFYMVLDTERGIFNYTSAGHNPVLLLDKSDMLVRQLSAKGLFLAMFPDVEYEEKTSQIEAGDILFMYTDGLVEAMNPQREQYGLDRVISRLMMYSEYRCEDMIRELMADVTEFADGEPFQDDVTILVVKKV